MECQYCKKVLQTKSSLTSHQLKTKYCLKLQGKDSKGSFECEYCKKTYTKKDHLQDHLKICIGNSIYVRTLRQELSELKQENAVLKQTIEILQKDKESWINHSNTLAKNPRNTTNTTNIHHNTLNLSVFNKTANDIKKIVEENYDKEYLIQGQKGVARFTHSHVLKTEDNQLPIYSITDKTRGNGKYRTSETEVVSDPGMFGLTKKIYPDIKTKAINIGIAENMLENQEMFDGYQEVFNMIDDNTIFREEMVKLAA